MSNTESLDSVMNDESYKPLTEGPEIETVESEPTSGGDGGFRFAIPEFLKAKSPDEPIENFINHPFNFDGTRGLAQMIKGFTGMFGSFNYAIADIFLGYLRWKREKGEIKVVN